MKRLSVIGSAVFLTLVAGCAAPEDAAPEEAEASSSKLTGFDSFTNGVVSDFTIEPTVRNALLNRDFDVMQPVVFTQGYATWTASNVRVRLSQPIVVAGAGTFDSLNCVLAAATATVDGTGRVALYPGESYWVNAITDFRVTSTPSFSGAGSFIGKTISFNIDAQSDFAMSCWLESSGLNNNYTVAPIQMY